jgi:hypothetical protein
LRRQKKELFFEKYENNKGGGEIVFRKKCEKVFMLQGELFKNEEKKE